MKSKTKPIRDLYFRFIEGTELDGKLNAQQCAEIMARHGYIKLVPHDSRPAIEHYRDTVLMAELGADDDTLDPLYILLVKEVSK